MDYQIENKEQMDKEIILDNMNHLNEFIDSTNEVTWNYKKFNEDLNIAHNRWLDYVRDKIKESENSSESNITFSGIKYDNSDSLLSILKNISQPYNYRNNNENSKNNSKSINEKEDIFDFMNLKNIMASALNTCSKKKRQSLLSKIHNDENKKDTSNDIINNDNLEYKENFEIEYNNEDDGDININLDEYNSNHKQRKIDYNNSSFGTSEKKDENSLCTIEEQPSMEDIEKSNFTQSSFNFFNSKKFASSHKINIQNNDDKNITSQNKNNYILDFNNNIINSNKGNTLSQDTEVKKNYKPINDFEAVNSSEKYNNYSSSQNIDIKYNNNNNYLLSNIKNNHNNLLINEQISPSFGQIKDFASSSQKKDIQNNFTKIVVPQFTFRKNNEKMNNDDFTFGVSTEKKNDNNYSNTKNTDSFNKKNVVFIHTSRKKNQDDNNKSNNYLSNNKNNQKINNNINTRININNANNNLITVLTNSINEINNQKLYNTNIKNNIINSNNINESEPQPINCVQKVVLSSFKKMKTLNNNNNVNLKKKKKKDKYEDDFEEYEISDSSIISEDDVIEKINKFVPKWARDKEYINQKVFSQLNNKDLIKKSFGDFVVDHLNLNMIFETHNEVLDIRNSTADWKEDKDDNNISKDKITNINDKEMDAMFPNRKLQF